MIRHLFHVLQDPDSFMRLTQSLGYLLMAAFESALICILTVGCITLTAGVWHATGKLFNDKFDNK